MTAGTDRVANLLGALGLATAGRVEAAAQEATGRPAAETATLVVLTTALGGTSQETLRRLLGLTQSGTTRLVARLVDAGLLEQRAGPDGRTHALVPTDTGRRVAGDALRVRAAALDDLLDVLDDDERDAAGRLAEKLLAGLTTGRDAARRVCRLCDPVACGHHTGRCPVTRAADAVSSPES
ncbi:MarR family transcriptional regulator [Actinomycetospora straminea]|uniref:MarR family transcriptional regulator n=1 Tax=Actinomycetospora straminea TaxID=663607 RepID=A0ABP9EYN8_9PSEU